MRLRTTLILALLLLAAFSAAAETLYCDHCGRPIQERYWESRGRIYCSEACYRASLPRCELCSEPMESWYVDARGRRLCAMCYQAELPRCEGCGSRMRTWVEIRGHRYCPRCAERPRCSACGLPEPGLEYPDGRHICDDCHRTAVINPDLAERIFREVRARIRRELGLGTDHPITFELVSRSELAERGGGDGQRELGLFRHESERETVVQVERDLLGRETSRRVVEERVVTRRFVDVLYGLPRTRFAGVVAHELAHDIEHERFPGLPRQLSEGWAELVAHRTHSLYQAPEWNQLIEENLDPIYGGGFRRVRDEERRRGGLEELMAWLATQASEASE